MRYISPARMLIISIVILALISASAMAISKSDLISSYKSPSGIPSSKPTVSPNSPSPTPTTAPVWALPTPVPSSGKSYFPSWFAPALPKFPSKGGSSSLKPTPLPTPTISTEDTGGYIPCPPGRPVGYLTPCFCSCMSYRNAETGEVGNAGCINPETGHSYPIGTDALGNAYLIKPGCQAQWP